MFADRAVFAHVPPKQVMAKGRRGARFHFLIMECSWHRGDSNYDSLIDIGDFARFGSNFNKVLPVDPSRARTDRDRSPYAYEFRRPPKAAVTGGLKATIAPSGGLTHRA